MSRLNFLLISICFALTVNLSNVFCRGEFAFVMFSVSDSVVLAKLVIAAICEEFFFRGFLLDLFLARAKENKKKCIYLVAVLFAAAHLLNYYSLSDYKYVAVQCSFAFAMGIGLNIIYVQYRSVVPCVAVHCIINITSIFNAFVANDIVGYSIVLALSVLYIIISTKQMEQIR